MIKCLCNNFENLSGKNDISFQVELGNHNVYLYRGMNEKQQRRERNTSMDLELSLQI
jgi:hypothetical protein